MTTRTLRTGEREEQQEKTGILCEIYRCDLHKGGTLQPFNTVTLLVGGPFEPSQDAPGVKLVRRTISGSDYLHVEPISEPAESRVGYMASGTFIYTSDSRFPSKQPLSVHDHTETPNQIGD